MRFRVCGKFSRNGTKKKSDSRRAYNRDSLSRADESTISCFLRALSGNKSCLGGAMRCCKANPSKLQPDYARQSQVGRSNSDRSNRGITIAGQRQAIVSTDQSARDCAGLEEGGTQSSSNI